jgi:hypothetical protein
MRICKYLTAAAIAVTAIVAAPIASKAQENALGTYSPYTMYGLGNLKNSTQSAFTGMGGASVAFRNGEYDTAGDVRLNVANPASLSGLPPRTFIFDVGLAGTNQYLSQQSQEGLLRTSFNTFNFNNLSIAMRLAPKLGMSLGVSPYSEVGYRIQTDDDSYLADLGVVRYFYNGQGDVNEAKAAVGWEPFKNFSVGVEANYLFGNIDRTYRAEILSYTGTGQYNQVTASTNEQVSRVFGAFGLQYSPLSKPRARLTLGATYRLGGKLNSQVRDYIPSGNIYQDVVRLDQYTSPVRMAQKIGAGVWFHRPKWDVGVDWLYEDWARGNQPDEANGVKYVNTQTFKIGGRYTPARYDMRGRFVSFFNRMSYKAGFRTGGNYMEFHGVPIKERAVSLGLDSPLRVDKISNLSMSVEYGQRGTLRQGLVKERFQRVNVGVMFFGSDYDYWFQKYKYN